ncbi:prepilin-type N-terminal cleavage/methylation domain-containing protein [Verrucomicrobiota bacterium]
MTSRRPRERNRRDKTRSCRTQGLTLIEVLLAVVILSMGLTMLLTAASRCLAVMKIARNYQTAQWVMGMGELDYPLVVDLIEDDIEDLEVEGETYAEDFTFSREVEEKDDEDFDDGLYVVRTRVAWSRRGRNASEEKVRYVWIPEDKRGN